MLYNVALVLFLGYDTLAFYPEHAVFSEHPVVECIGYAEYTDGVSAELEIVSTCMTERLYYARTGINIVQVKTSGVYKS